MSLREPERRGAVGWIFIGDTQSEMEATGDYPANAVAEALAEFRWDESIRVVVLTGQQDGQFYRLARRSHWDDPRFHDRLDPRRAAGSKALGATKRIPSAHESILLMDKPVIARVNGDAIGFGSSLIWLSDVVVARDDALIAYGFGGLGSIIDSNGEARGMPWALTPTYGTPSFQMMSPLLMKEFIMLSRVFTGKELAEARVLNYSLPMAELDAKVDEIIEKFLARPQHMLARSKRLVNKHLVEQFNLTEDLAAAYSQLDLWQLAASGAMA